MPYDKQVPSDILTVCQLAIGLKQSDWSAHSVAFCPAECFHEWAFPSARRKVSRAPQVKQMTCSFMRASPATPLYCFVLLLYRVSMAMCAACIHGKSFISFVSLERGTRGITEPQDTQSQTSLRARPGQ